jgi:hypothetical protein
MNVDPRRKPTYDLLMKVVAGLKQAHKQAINAAIKVLPEAKTMLTEAHDEYSRKLDELTSKCHEPPREEHEPAWVLLTLLVAMTHDENVLADVDVFDQIMHRYNLPIGPRD